MAELEHRRIAKRIKQARTEAGLTQQQMAELLGVIQRTYQNYESERTPRIPWDRMSDIERITGKKVEWLLHGEAPDLVGQLSAADSPLAGLVAGLADVSEKLDQLLDRVGALESSVAVEAAANADSRSQIAALERSLAPGATGGT